MLAELATSTTVAPWEMQRAKLARAHAAGLSDEDVLQAIALSAYFGHLNRIADAVGVPLDYDVKLAPPATDPSVPALAPAPATRVGRPALDLATRPETQRAIAEWRDYAFKRDEPLTRRQRTFIARCVARWVGDGSISPPDDLTGNPLDDALRELAETVTLAPWQLGAHSFSALRDAGFDDAALFDVCATASIAGMISRLEVALVALAT
jgi:alkylhydroperoxidase family enzyme